MILKTTALVLRFYPFSNTSRIVSWMTPDQGRLVTMIKGSQRPRSQFLGQYDLFYTCELLFYRRERGGLHIARECAPLKMRPRLRRDWKAAAAASYISGLVSQAVPPEAPHEGVFALLDGALDELESSGAGLPFLFWFELRLLDQLGLSPRLRRCAACGNALASEPHRTAFAVARGGLLCPACTGDSQPGGAAPSRRFLRDESVPPPARHPRGRVRADVVSMLAAWQQARSPQGPLSTQCTPQQLSAVETVLGGFLAYHLDFQPIGRRAALDVLARRVA